jgi:hypothetical protein
MLHVNKSVEPEYPERDAKRKYRASRRQSSFSRSANADSISRIGQNGLVDRVVLYGL